jgi:hypothetical protein
MEQTFNAMVVALNEVERFSQIYADLSTLDMALEQLIYENSNPSLISITHMDEILAKTLHIH